MFHKNRPKIKLEKTEFDVLIDCANLIVLTVYLSYIFLQFQQLPETIPTHFNAEGIADGFGSKFSIWILPFIAFLIVVGFKILNNYPHQFNYLVKITEENAPRQYQLGTRIIRFTAFYILLLFFYISYATISTAKHNETNALGSWFLPVVMVSSILFPVIILIKMSSIK